MMIPSILCYMPPSVELLGPMTPHFKPDWCLWHRLNCIWYNTTAFDIVLLPTCRSPHRMAQGNCEWRSPLHSNCLRCGFNPNSIPLWLFFLKNYCFKKQFCYCNLMKNCLSFATGLKIFCKFVIQQHLLHLICFAWLENRSMPHHLQRSLTMSLSCTLSRVYHQNLVFHLHVFRLWCSLVPCLFFLLTNQHNRFLITPCLLSCQGLLTLDLSRRLRTSQELVTLLHGIWRAVWGLTRSILLLVCLLRVRRICQYSRTGFTAWQ